MPRPATPSRHPLTPIAHALLVVFLGAAATAGLPAATAHAAEAAAIHLDIPAGSLDQALSRFGRQAGIQIAVNAELTAGRQSPGVSGSHDIESGLRRLLAGTGLQAARDGGGEYTLRRLPPAASGETTLGAVLVTAEGLGATTEHTGSYTTGSASTATRMNLSLRETPQSVSVLTRRQIDDLGLTTLDDAVHNVTGLVMQKGYYVGDSGSFSARGFPISNLLLDGLPLSTGANGTFNADNDALDIYDRIEVVRGATGLTTGAGTPSAAINLVRKRPTAQTQASVTLSAGSWNNFRAAVDAGGPLNAAGTLRGRAVVTAQDTEHFYDVAHDRNQQIYGILEADLAPSTVATLGFHYRNVDDQGGYARLPANPDGSFLAGLKRSTNLSNDFDYWKQTDQTVFSDLTHRFDNGWQARLAAVWKRPEQDILFSGLSRSGGILYQNTQRYRLDNRQDSYDLSLQGPFSLLGRSHELMFGASYREYHNKDWGGWAAYSWTTAGPVVDPYDWDASAVPEPAIDMTLWGLDVTTRQHGLYAATRLSLADPLTVILGARLNWYENENHRTGSQYSVDHELTPYAGAVYDLDGKHSVYASWTEIFEPQSSRDRNGELIAPITGTNYEAGIKGEYFGGRLNASLAAFLIKQQNRATNDLGGPNPCPGSAWGYCQRASGEVESKGVELEVGGALTPDWQIMAGYTYVAAKYTKDADRANIGKPFDSSLPRNQLKLATSYRLPGELSRWRVGGSLHAQDRIKSSDGAPIEQSGHAIVGLNAAYSLNSQTDIRLNVNNLFDKRYYQNVGWLTGGNVIGTPRNFTLTLHFRL